MSWNRTYRPRSASQLHLVKTREIIEGFLEAGYVPQSLLFSGPKGTGKTTTSRIIASVLNDPKNKAAVQTAYMKVAPEKNSKASLIDTDIDSSLNKQILSGNSHIVHELDAASNRGIDDIRSLKEKVFIPPADGLVSVYILDEAHMLTTEAFNALLKILEEPPPHAVFILATTERHKLPATIISRCQEVVFTKASDEELRHSLEKIVEAENIKIKLAEIDLIVENSDGSFRDAVKVLEQVARAGIKSKNEIKTLLKLQSFDDFENLLAIILEKDSLVIINYFSDLRKKSSDPKKFLQGFLRFLHAKLISAYSDEQHSATNPAVFQYLLKHLGEIQLFPHNPIPFLEIELVLLDMISRSQKNNEPTNKKNQHQRDTANNASSAKNEKMSAKPKIDNHKTKLDIVKPSLEKIGDSKIICEKWHEFTKKVGEHNFTLAALLSSASPESNKIGHLRINVFYSFHKEQLTQPKFLVLVTDIIETVCGGKIIVEFQVTTPPEVSQLTEPKNADQSLQQLAVEALM